MATDQAIHAGVPSGGSSAIEPGQIAAWDSAFRDSLPEEILAWAVGRYAPAVALSCSFGGPSGMVILDMLAERSLLDKVTVYYLDTGLLFPEAHELRERAERRYGIRVVAWRPALSLEEQADQLGPALWERNPDLCCYTRKVLPNAAALRGIRCWIAGLRKDQFAARSEILTVSWSESFDLLKVNPLAGWTEADIWGYVRQRDVPYNALHDDGYPSIGCTVCTARPAPGADPRSGRWRGFAKTECGIHLGPVGFKRPAADSDDKSVTVIQAGDR